ncbi:MAG: endonuclease/exonuclease/phosphatase family protein [Saprospiraceae bacterium]
MKTFLLWGNKFFGVVIIITTLVLIYLPNYTMLDFITEYLVFYVIFLLISGIVGLIFNQKYILYVSFGCAFMLTLFLKYSSNSDLKLPKPNNQPTIGIIHINLSSISSFDILQKLVQDKNYDVISFQEVTPDWDGVLSEIFRDSFPYDFEEFRLDLQGKSIFSKYPMDVKPDISIHNIKGKVIEIIKQNERYRLLSVYLTPPLDPKNKIENEMELDEMTEVMLHIPNPAFVLGELNRVYWAKPIIEFRKISQLMNSRRNAQLSFKTSYNHIFYTGDMECYHFEDVFDETNVSIGCRGLYQKKKLNKPKRRFRKYEG